MPGKTATKKRKRTASSPRWTAEHDTLKSLITQHLTLKLPNTNADDQEWLLATREAHAFILRLDKDETKLNNLIDVLVSFHTIASQRHSDILKCVKQRMIELETRSHKDTWVKVDVVVPVPPNQLLPPNFGLQLDASASPLPDGLVVSGYTKDPFGQSGPGELSGRLRMGDIITAFRPGAGNGSVAVRAALNMFVNLSVLRMLAPTSVNGGGGSVALAKLPSLDSVTLSLKRLDDKSMQMKQTATSRALSPERLFFVSSSPLLISYARATHPKRGDDTLWLLNRDSVANIIVAPLERREELATLFANKKVALIGSQGVLTPSWTASLDKMYDLFYVYELVQKYIDHGEVGRGRNKTSLKTSKQVVNVVVAALKKGGLLKK
jgi:hypothetical protein